MYRKTKNFTISIILVSTNLRLAQPRNLSRLDPSFLSRECRAGKRALASRDLEEHVIEYNPQL